MNVLIELKELRIGNRIWESNSFTPSPEYYNEITIASINDIDKVVRDDQGNGYSYDALYPIPLTPKWLQRCGFSNKHDQGELLFIGPFYLHDDEDGSYTFTWYGSKIGTRLRYVHQLQNLYFALTGEELTIKS